MIRGKVKILREMDECNSGSHIYHNITTKILDVILFYNTGAPLKKVTTAFTENKLRINKRVTPKRY